MSVKGILREFQGIERNWKSHVMAQFPCHGVIFFQNLEEFQNIFSNKEFK